MTMEDARNPEEFAVALVDYVREHDRPQWEAAIEEAEQRGAQQERERLEPLIAAAREHVRYLDDENEDPLLKGHSVGCRVIQRPTEDNKYTTGTQHVADCAVNHRRLAEAVFLADPEPDR